MGAEFRRQPQAAPGRVGVSRLCLEVSDQASSPRSKGAISRATIVEFHSNDGPRFAKQGSDAIIK